MRRAVFALLLCSATAAAQPFISDEILSDPLKSSTAAPPFAVPAVAMAKDRGGPAIAWSMGAKIYVARLDPAGHVGAVRELPRAEQAMAVDAVAPSMAAAPGGDGFVVGWIEFDPYLMRKAYSVVCRLDAAMAPSTPTSLLSFGQMSASPIIVRTSGDTTWIAAGGFLWSLAQDGALRGPFPSMVASDMTVAANAPQLIGSHEEKSQTYTYCQDGCAIGHFPGLQYCPEQCRIYPVYFALDFSTLGTWMASTTFNFYSDAQPAIASSDGELLLAWFRGAQTSGGEVVLSRMAAGDVSHFDTAANSPIVLSSFPSDAGQTRPDIATDGTRTLVVWRAQAMGGNHDIVGAAIDEKGKLTPFVIATSPADERDPAVLSLGGGTFLVAYEKVSGGERRIAGRFVSFGVPRHRATR